MKNYFLLLTISFLMQSNVVFTQFTPDYTDTYSNQVKIWDHSFDSIRLSRLEVGDSSMKGTGYTSYLRWKRFWSSYAPSSGSFDEALNAFIEVNDLQKKKHFKSLQVSPNNQQSLIANPINFTEIGPTDFSKIKMKTGATWTNPHVNNTGTLRFDGHVAKIDRLIQHPTIPNKIYALAGGLSIGGGGLAVSENGGNDWTILGTDKIAIPDVIAFAIKPSEEAPNIGEEYLFIGLSTGAIYRSKDNGLNWIECGYNGTVTYPFVFGNSNVNSLPYSDDFYNFNYGVDDLTGKYQFTKNGLQSNNYSRLIVARSEGLFFSDNYFADINISPSSYQMTNNIIWGNLIDNNALLNQIPPNQNSIGRKITFTDFEDFSKNSTFYYVAHFEVIEKIQLTPQSIVQNEIKQYVIISNDFGQTWSFLGGINAPVQGTTIAYSNTGKASVNPGNIEVKDLNPNYIYIASPRHPEGYYLFKYVIDDNIFIDLSQTSFISGIATQANGFAINPNNEENWWFTTNQIDRQLNGTFSSFAINNYDYGKRHHADTRDLIILSDSDILAATDGGVYKSTDGGNMFSCQNKGLNFTQVSGGLGVTQQPPYYIACGFEHGGINVYNPEIDEWHNKIIGDGGTGTSVFLNNQIYAASNQHARTKVFKGFNDFNEVFYGGGIAGSENKSGRIYGIYRSAPFDKLWYTNDDFTTEQPVQNIQSFTYERTIPIVIPNEPDKVAILEAFGSSNTSTLYFYSGFNQTIPTPTLIQAIDLNAIYQSFTGDLTDFAFPSGIVFDTRKNGDFYMVLRTGVWEENGRIVKYNAQSQEFEDYTFVTDDDINGQIGANFPAFISINDIIQDRETGILYISTTFGIYYLDLENEMWRKYSSNIPHFGAKMDIVHCTGELYVGSENRGVWKAPLIRNESVPKLEWKITQTQTWTDRTNLFCTLIIEPGATLTLKGDLIVYGDQKIIVKPGGKFIVDGGKISTECGEWWEGIEVWGNPSLSQHNYSNQGQLVTLNNAIIENAHEAIRVWKPGDWSSMGGIVTCSNTTFKNNWRSCEYMPYHSYNAANTIEYPNKGRFTNCEFIWDDAYLSNSATCGISMYHINGVRISACTFRDDRTTVSSSSNRPNGITSLDAGYKVLGRNTGPSNAPVHHEFSETNYDVSYFKNLRNGIYAMNSQSQNMITVDHAKFENMINGIFLSSVDNAVLTRNMFDYTLDHPADIFIMREMLLSKSTGFTVEGNIFTKEPPSTQIVGALVYNSGFAPNQIYRNKYQNLYASNYANGENTNDVGEDQASGLQFLCNDYSGSVKYDEFVYTFPNANENGQGIRLKQGTSQIPAGNEFSIMNPGQGRAHISSTDFDNILYYAHNSQIPTLLEGGVGVQVITPENLCPSNFTSTISPNTGVLLTTSTKLQLQNDLASINSTYQQKSSELSALLLDGDSDYLHQLVANLSSSTKQTVKNELLNASPYLSESLLIELGEKTPSIFPPTWYKSIIEANVEVAQNKSFIHYLNNKPDPLAPGLVNNIIQYTFSHTTERGTKMDELSDLNSDKSIILNYLISNEISDSTEMNWSDYKNLIIQRDDIICRSQLADMYFGKKDISQCDDELGEIDIHINEYMIEELRQEMLDYSTFKKYLITIIDSSGVVKDLDSEHIAQLNYIAENFKGKSSVQAKNILCFLTGQCEDVIVEFGNEKRSLEIPIPSKNDLGNVSEFELEITPNPNSGIFNLTAPNGCVIQNVYLNDIQGRKVEFKLTRNSENTVELEMNEPKIGIYLVSIVCDGVNYTERILVK